MTERSRLDWWLVAALAGLIVAGTLSILSAASPMSYYPMLLKKHFIALFLGVLLFLFGSGFNYQIFQDQARPLYVMIVGILVAVLIFGATQRGHKAWFHLPYFSFQPVEIARVGMILVLANFLDRRSRKILEPATVFWSLALVGPVMVLILKQPDFASMVTFFPILIGMLFCAGAGLGQLLALLGYGGIALSFPLAYTLCQIHYSGAAPGTWQRFVIQVARMGGSTALAVGGIALLSVAAWKLCGWMRMQLKAVYFLVVPLVLSGGLLSGVVVNRELKGYQRNRFVAFLSPETDIQGASYNVHQSQIAIGSGGLFGKGLFSGTQSQLGFLPERHTDFIFAVIGEELGFLGAGGIIGLYLILIWRIIATAKVARDRYGFLVCAGLASMFSFHLLLNVGMCLGIMPVAGIPLPLISYGGSSLVATLWALGIVSNVHSRRYSLL